MPIAYLDDRGVVSVSGEDAEKFLQGIVTCDLDRATPARFGALLSPQGKILFDFLLMRREGGFLLDTARASAADLAKRLGFYKLRAKVNVEDVSDRLGVVAGWDEPVAEGGFGDPRLPGLGWRAIVERETAPVIATAGSDAYHVRRIALGVPESGRDFTAAETFPHEADMDQLGGVDFDKGCFVGQEVVSRMQHRGTARTRAVPVVFTSGTAPEDGGEVFAGGKSAGRLGSVAGGRGIAVLRLDRVADAMAAGDALTAGGLELAVERPDWARFTFPGDKP